LRLQVCVYARSKGGIYADCLVPEVHFKSECATRARERRGRLRRPKDGEALVSAERNGVALFCEYDLCLRRAGKRFGYGGFERRRSAAFRAHKEPYAVAPHNIRQSARAFS
jgi:hypothetical protein